MDVVVVKNVVARPEHRREHLAGSGVDVAEESLSLVVATRPVVDDRDAAAIRQAEAADVDGVAESVFRNVRARLPVDAAAGIRAHGVDLRDRLAEARLSDGLHDLFDPFVESGDHRTIEGRHRVELNPVLR